MGGRSKVVLTAIGVAIATVPTATFGGPVSSLPDQAVIIRQFDNDLLTKFSFARTIGQILTSAGIANTPDTRRDFVQTMLSSYSINAYINPASGLPMPVDVRPNEAGLSAAALLDANGADGLIPIGLFNRVDLAPANWTDCGEHRIVYSLKPGSAHERFFVIFEAKLPNPGTGQKACRPVAKQWIAIGKATTAAARNAALDKLYYGGLTGFSPVVSYLNYGGFLGQVRTNNFVGFTKWQLREFRVTPVAAQTLAFVPGPDASNPLAEFYKNNPVGNAFEQSERTAFQSRFGTAYLPNLRQVDATEPAATSDTDFGAAVINRMGAGFDFRFNEFQSDSQGPADQPAGLAGSAIKALIPASWPSPISASRTITQAELLNRAGAMTCGGCHLFSGGAAIGHVGGQPISWPAPLAFVHINNTPNATGLHPISPALINFFIPFRKLQTDKLAGPQFVFPHFPLDLLIRQWIIRRPPLPDPGPEREFLARITPSSIAPATVRAQRARAAVLARQVLAPVPVTTLSAVKIRSLNTQRVSALTELRRLSDEARTLDALTPGAFVEVRRPH